MVPNMPASRWPGMRQEKWFDMHHAGMFFHFLHVRKIVGDRSQDEFVIAVADVAQHKPDLFTHADRQPIRNEHHLVISVVFLHEDLDSSGRFARIARLAIRQFVLVSVRKGAAD